MRTVLGAILATTLTAASAAALQPRYRVLFSTTDDSGHESEFRVLEMKLLSTKKWSPESEVPPLAIRDAIANARKRINPRRPSDLVVTKIELSVAPDGEDRWFYVIEFYDRTQLMKASPPWMQEIVVLMDGSVVDPVPARPH